MMTTKLRKEPNLLLSLHSWMLTQPTYIRLIGVMVTGVLIVGSGKLVLHLFSAQPKTYEDYMGSIDQVLAIDAVASKASGAYQPLDQQIDAAKYNQLVLGENNAEYDLAVNAQSDTIKALEQAASRTELDGNKTGAID